MDGRRATPCALKHPLSAYPAGVFYYESHALLHLVRADPTMASIGVSLETGSRARGGRVQDEHMMQPREAHR